jgi:hypothetical protein
MRSVSSRLFLYSRYLAFSFITCVCFSCGIEDYIYLDPVEIINNSTVNGAQFVLPDSSNSPYFRSYAIYYRIYLSDYNTAVITVTTNTERNNINPVLASHFNTIDPYITNEDYAPSGINSIFNRLNYFPLYVSLNRTNEIDLSYLFSLNGFGSVPGVTRGEMVDIAFTIPPASSNGPFMTLSFPLSTTFVSSPHYLFRSSKAKPFPNADDRLFFWSDDLFTSENITVDRNLDIEKPITAGFNDSTKTAYVSMYVLAVGIDYNYSPVFSRPLHIGIFKLLKMP